LIEIVNLLRTNQAVAGCDASVKNGMIGTAWVLMTRSKRILTEREVYLKDWQVNTEQTVEAIILLNFIQTVYNKAYELEVGVVIISMDNKKVWNNVHEGIKVANHFNQAAELETLVIKQLKEKILIEIIIDRVNSHRIINLLFEQNPGPYLIKYYH